jgi:hypothetical protein
VGATLDDIKDVAVWHFGPKRFRIEFHGDPPADMIHQILGREAKVKQIEGEWLYQENKDEISLNDITAGEFKNPKEVVLPMTPAGRLRTDLGGRQYNIMEFSVRGRWESVGKGPKVSLTFTYQPSADRGNPFTAQCDQGDLPETLTAGLLGDSLKVSRIEGEWKFDQFVRGDKKVVFTKLKSGDHRRDKSVEAAVAPADILEIELLGGRYRRVAEQ